MSRNKYTFLSQEYGGWFMSITCSFKKITFLFKNISLSQSLICLSVSVCLYSHTCVHACTCMHVSTAVYILQCRGHRGVSLSILFGAGSLSQLCVPDKSTGKLPRTLRSLPPISQWACWKHAWYFVSVWFSVGSGNLNSDILTCTIGTSYTELSPQSRAVTFRNIPFTPQGKDLSF